jgi:hypothetical protein
VSEDRGEVLRWSGASRSLEQDMNRMTVKHMASALAVFLTVVRLGDDDNDDNQRRQRQAPLNEDRRDKPRVKW